MELVASNRLPALHAAVLPASRSARVGNPVTAFAMVINAGPTAANACGIALNSPIPATMNYQTTDETTNALTGTVNTPVSIPAGGRQSFVIGVTPSDAFVPTEVQFSFDCENSAPAGVLVGINTLLMSASNMAVPDLIALAATTGNNGIVDVPGVGGVGAFAVASVNLGSGGSITVSADAGSVAVPVNLNVCQTDPQSGICIGAPADFGEHPGQHQPDAHFRRLRPGKRRGTVQPRCESNLRAFSRHHRHRARCHERGGADPLARQCGALN